MEMNISFEELRNYVNKEASEKFLHFSLSYEPLLKIVSNISNKNAISVDRRNLLFDISHCRYKDMATKHFDALIGLLQHYGFRGESIPQFPENMDNIDFLCNKSGFWDFYESFKKFWKNKTKKDRHDDSIESKVKNTQKKKKEKERIDTTYVDLLGDKLLMWMKSGIPLLLCSDIQLNEKKAGRIENQILTKTYFDILVFTELNESSSLFFLFLFRIDNFLSMKFNKERFWNKAPLNETKTEEEKRMLIQTIRNITNNIDNSINVGGDMNISQPQQEESKIAKTINSVKKDYLKEILNSTITILTNKYSKWTVIFLVFGFLVFVFRDLIRTLASKYLL